MVLSFQRPKNQTPGYPQYKVLLDGKQVGTAVEGQGDSHRWVYRPLDDGRHPITGASLYDLEDSIRAYYVRRLGFLPEKIETDVEVRHIRHGHGQLARTTWCGEPADLLTFGDIDGAAYHILAQCASEPCGRCLAAVVEVLSTGDPFPADGFGDGAAGRIRRAIKAAPELPPCGAKAGPEHNDDTCVLLQHDKRTPHEVIGPYGEHQWFTEKRRS